MHILNQSLGQWIVIKYLPVWSKAQSRLRSSVQDPFQSNSLWSCLIHTCPLFGLACTWYNPAQPITSSSNFTILPGVYYYQDTPQDYCWECNSPRLRTLILFTSRSFFLSSSLSAIRFLLSSSSFSASLVSVRSLSSFRILRSFLRPLRSSSSPSSPLCGNEH